MSNSTRLRRFVDRLAVPVGILFVVSCSTSVQEDASPPTSEVPPEAALHDKRLNGEFIRITGERSESPAQEERVSVTQFSAADISDFGIAAVASVLGFSPSLEMESYGTGTEEYDVASEERFQSPFDRPLSTFSIDVDTASYSNVRSFLESGVMPPRGAVRIEEFINYFPYDYPDRESAHPITVVTELTLAPWSPRHALLQVGLQGIRIAERDLPPCNLVFLLDVSGSMQPPAKLPLVKRALRELAGRLRPQDRVAIVVYAGASGLVLPATSGSDTGGILDALERLSAGGSTNGGEGIQLAYDVARQGFDPNAINRVILATDGDFNVGITNRSDLIDLIERERESGIFLTVLGVGTGNLKDATMEQLADRGNGQYAYLDGIAEARKVLVTQAGGTLVTIAKDVKIQVEFNPQQVAAYRLIGYDNRRLADRDFDDDRVDAGEMGAGHSVTAFYEIVPASAGEGIEAADPLRYQQRSRAADPSHTGELALVRIRYKEPDGDSSRLLEHIVSVQPVAFDDASTDLRFGASVALMGMLLRGSAFSGEGDFTLVEALASNALDRDPHGLRSDFVQLVARARDLEAAVVHP
jgi:Ca-activated chloride channel family protein